MNRRNYRVKLAFLHHRVGDVLEDVPPDIANHYRGYLELADEVESPSRPAKMSAKAAKVVAEGAKRLFG